MNHSGGTSTVLTSEVSIFVVFGQLAKLPLVMQKKNALIPPLPVSLGDKPERRSSQRCSECGEASEVSLAPASREVLRQVWVWFLRVPVWKAETTIAVAQFFLSCNRLTDPAPLLNNLTSAFEGDIQGGEVKEGEAQREGCA